MGNEATYAEDTTKAPVAPAIPPQGVNESAPEAAPVVDAGTQGSGCCGGAGGTGCGCAPQADLPPDAIPFPTPEQPTAPSGMPGLDAVDALAAAMGRRQRRKPVYTKLLDLDPKYLDGFKEVQLRGQAESATIHAFLEAAEDRRKDMLKQEQSLWERLYAEYKLDAAKNYSINFQTGALSVIEDAPAEDAPAEDGPVAPAQA